MNKGPDGDHMDRETFWEEVILRSARSIGSNTRGSSWRAGDDLLWYNTGPMGTVHLVNRNFFSRA